MYRIDKKYTFMGKRKVKGVKVEKISNTQQPDMNKQSKQQNNRKKSRGGEEDLSFSDVMELMKHSSYKRHKGAIKQIK